MNNIDIKKLIDELETSVKACQNETQIIEAKNIFLKNTVNPLYSKIKTLPDSEKSEYGKNLNLLKEKVNSLVEEYLSSILQEKEKKEHKVDYDIELNSTNLTKGSVSPITLVFRQILSYFQKLNFTIQSGEEVMDAKYNFDHLNIPVTHPTREPSETFYLNEEKTLSLRTQNTASSAQFIDNFKGDEIRVANFGYVYRNDDDDPTHSHQFNQIDFI
jgi:phenylalanyl-tRNA synthetase alpha chain